MILHFFLHTKNHLALKLIVAAIGLFSIVFSGLLFIALVLQILLAIYPV